MEKSKNNIKFNDNEYQLKIKLSIYVIDNIKLLKNGYIFIYFASENKISEYRWDYLNEEEKKKASNKTIFQFYNPRTFKIEISFIEDSKIYLSRELSNGNLILFFNQYFKIYKISKKNLTEIQKINYSIKNFDNLNFLELSSTEFLLNEGDTIKKQYHRHESSKNDKNILTIKYILNDNKKYISENANNIPFGKFLKFRDTFILIQTFNDPQYSGRYVVSKHIYLCLNNEFIFLFNIPWTDIDRMPSFKVLDGDLFLFYGREIHKYLIDYNNLCALKKNIVDFKYNTLLKVIHSFYDFYFDEKDNTLNLFLKSDFKTVHYFKLSKEFKLIRTEIINFTNRFKELVFIKEDFIILKNPDNSYNVKTKNALYFYEKINKNHLSKDMIKNDK